MQGDHELEFEILEERQVLDAYIYKLVHSRRRSYSGRVMDVHTLVPPDWVQVLALVKDEAGQDCFLMVRQYRHGVRRVLTEFPGGMVDPGETPAQAAQRELLEETGHRCGRLIHLGTTNPNPAIQSNNTHAFLALDLDEVSHQELDEHEAIHVHKIPVKTVEDQMGLGDFDHGIMLMALWWYRRYLDSQK